MGGGQPNDPTAVPGGAEMAKKNNLEILRDEIDEIDEQLVGLINRRVALARHVGVLKREIGDKVIYRPEREAQILRRIKDVSPGDISNEALVGLFREIISACRGAESVTRVAALGPEGTYTQTAALKHFGNQIETALTASIEEVFRLVESGEANYGVVPVENSIEGGVSNTLDALFERNVTLVGEVNLPIRHALLSRSGRLGEVREVLAHPQALGQCRRWLAAHLHGIPLKPVTSNAEAARLAAEDDGRAAIAGESVAGLYTLNIVERGIQDSSDNTTRFVIIGLTPAQPSGRDKTSIVLSAKNRPGALFDLLQPLARHDIDMTRIESRPARRGLWEYLFYVDFSGHCSENEVATALRELEHNSALFKLLGSYPAAVD
jgi:chorismate mutase/prephenate dehydratase